jgi:hypothetical protein
LRRAITAQPEEQRRLLDAMAVCALEGFWFPLTVAIAGLTEAKGRDARNRLVDASLLRMLDRARKRFQLHALLREELRNLAPLEELQAAHAVALERLFGDWERHWRECRECLAEIIPVVQHLWENRESSRAARLTYLGARTGKRIGELETALRILQQQEALCLELGDKDGLWTSYGNQALILKAWGRLEEAFELHQKVGALSLRNLSRRRPRTASGTGSSSHRSMSALTTIAMGRRSLAPQIQAARRDVFQQFQL